MEVLNNSEYTVDNHLESEWKYKINNSTHYVKDIDLYQYILEPYLGKNYAQTIRKRELENSIYNFMKENYAKGQELIHSGDFNMFSLTDKEKNIILNEYKKKNVNIEYSDDELLSIIDHQAFKIWSENLKSPNI